MGEGAAAVKGMAAQLATMLQVQGGKGRDEWSQLHVKLAEVAAAAAGDDPRTTVQALVKVAKDASSSQAWMRTFVESVSKASPALLKDLVLLVAHQLNMVPLCDSVPVRMVDEDGNFCEGNVGRIIHCSPELSAPNTPYAVISIVGAQSSGKSYLLNRLFGTKFPVMDASRGWSQTTRGIMISRCIGPSLLLLDVEGFDGREKGQDTRFEKQAALFALTVSDLMIVNMYIVDVGREEGGGTQLFRTIFQERTKIERAGLTKILVVLRAYNGETPLENLRDDVLKRLQKTWESVNVESMKFKDYIEVDVFGMPDKESPKFPKEVTLLRRLLSKNTSAKVPASSFRVSSRIFWDTIKQNKKLDIPSHQVLISSLHCQLVVELTLNTLDLWEYYKLLKAEKSPSRFRKISDALLEGITAWYDQKTEMYDPDVRDKQRRYLLQKLYEIFTNYGRGVIWKMMEFTSEHYKGEFNRNIQNIKQVHATSYGEMIVNECIENFMSSCEDLKVFDSDYLHRICGVLEQKMQSHTSLHILAIKEERVREGNEKLKKNAILASISAIKLAVFLLTGGVVNLN